MSEGSFYYGCCCQSLLLTSFMYTVYDLFQRSKQYLMNVAYKAWWAALDVYITADEFYNQRILPTYNAVVLAKDIAVVSAYDTISRATDARLPRSIRGHVVGYVNACRERTLMRTTMAEEQHTSQHDNNVSGMENDTQSQSETQSHTPSQSSRTIPNPFISMSVQLAPSGGAHARVMDDIIIPNGVIQKYCIMGTYIDIDLLDYILHMHCKHLFMGMDVSPDTIDTVTILDTEVNMKVFKMTGSTAQCIVFNEDGTYSIVSREEMDDSESAEDEEAEEEEEEEEEEEKAEEQDRQDAQDDTVTNADVEVEPPAQEDSSTSEHPHSE